MPPFENEAKTCLVHVLNNVPVTVEKNQPLNFVKKSSYYELNIICGFEMYPWKGKETNKLGNFMTNR